MSTQSRPRSYFAARSRQDIGNALVGKLQILKKGSVDDNSAEIANAVAHYYGKDSGAGLSWGVTRGGDDGRLAQFRVNTARSYLKAYHSIVTASKVTWRPMASNADASPAAAVTLAQNILEDLWRNHHLARAYLLWVEQALVCSKAYVFDEWDLGLGPPLMASGGRMVLQGDLNLHNLLPWDVKEDPNAPSPRACTWRFARLWKNRFDVAKLCTRLADGRHDEAAEDAILSACEGKDVREFSGKLDAEDDLVPVWHFFHDKTPALPAGRETVFISSDCVLRDGPLTYAKNPVHRLAADEMFGGPHAWTSFWDQLGAQEVRDAVHTTLATIITTLGNPSLAMELGSEVDVEDVVAGFRKLSYPRGGKPPTAVQLAEFPADALKYEEALGAQQRSIQGLDELSAGQFDGKQLNAQAFAVLTSLTTQKASPFQTACLDALGELGTSMLATYRRRVSRERQLKVTGKSSKTAYDVIRWSGEKLAPIDGGVVVDIGNPAEQTAAGRAQVLESLMAVPGAVTTPEEVIEVLDTGRLEAATRAVRDELLLIKSEYEMLQEGKVPPVHPLQNHALHYRENGAVLYNPQALMNPAVQRAVEEHLAEHYEAQYGVALEQDPLAPVRQAFLMGRQPDPTMMPPAPPMGGPPPAPPPEAGPPPMTGAPAEPPPVEPPELPIDPRSGQPLEIPSGGMQ